MRKYTKTILVTLGAFAFLFATTAFVMNDPTADFLMERIRMPYPVSLSAIDTDHTDTGNFKSSVQLRLCSSEGSTKEFYGQEILISDNPEVDRILVGVTNNLISRIEIWNDDALIETKELGFVGMMTLGQPHTLSISFFDQSNAKHPGKSRISMRFYSGTGFFGDVGTIHADLSRWGDLSGSKSITLFSKSLDSGAAQAPDFSDLKIWKNYKSAD